MPRPRPLDGHYFAGIACAGLAIVLGVGGCLPLPFATPPVRISYGAGGAGGRFRPTSEQRATAHPFEPLNGTRIALHPLAMAPPLIDRPADFGVGYFAEWVPRPITATGSRVVSLIGSAFGEGGIGLEITGGLRQVDDVRYGTVMVNLTMRVPASAGIALIPIPSLWR